MFPSSTIYTRLLCMYFSSHFYVNGTIQCAKRKYMIGKSNRCKRTAPGGDPGSNIAMVGDGSVAITKKLSSRLNICPVPKEKALFLAVIW